MLKSKIRSRKHLKVRNIAKMKGFTQENTGKAILYLHLIIKLHWKFVPKGQGFTQKSGPTPRFLRDAKPFKFSQNFSVLSKVPIEIRLINSKLSRSSHGINQEKYLTIFDPTKRFLYHLILIFENMLWFVFRLFYFRLFYIRCF